MSDEDLGAGSRWSAEIATNLELNDVGIVCVSQSNLNAPWIHFEAGALSKSVASGIVVPLLHKVSVAELQGLPLAQFQAKRSSEREDMFDLMRRLNEAAVEAPLDSARLERAFAAAWPDMNDALMRVADDDNETLTSPTPDIGSVLDEVLQQMTVQNERLATIERRLPQIRRPTSKRPASQASPARAAVRQEIDHGFAVGQLVEHPSFGRGTLIELRGSGETAEATVEFPEIGPKYLSLAWAPLRTVVQDRPAPSAVATPLEP